ncbi:MAG: GAF domain-containing protein [Thermoanaerobaculia bacterium]|nr:GAF domain-containing protein [Thermoanaerobaculia bacterium]
MSGAPSRAGIYDPLIADLEATLAGIDDAIAAMATVACLIYERVPGVSFAGFYRRVGPELLRIGPYQGPLGCLEIPFARGVCGAAARERRTQLVPDVHAFPGHIACDAGAQSEIVVPVLDQRGEVAAVLDVDSHLPANFDADDLAGLEKLVRTLSPRLTHRPASAFAS